MNKFLFSTFAVVACLAALAEPCVLEKGYKPPAKQADDEVVSLLGELSSDKAAEPQAAETAAGKMPAPPVTETVTGNPR